MLEISFCGPIYNFNNNQMNKTDTPAHDRKVMVMHHLCSCVYLALSVYMATLLAQMGLKSEITSNQPHKRYTGSAKTYRFEEPFFKLRMQN